ncbi:MAG: hypothetical protein HQK51_01780 [Oligoflexia bacterium]|nr:hypothetical protein [Oligoflexia bacterium]
MNFDETLAAISSIKIKQILEHFEIFGIETRNKYQFMDEKNSPIAFAAEQSKGFGFMILRQILGHWRSFKISFFDNERKEIFSAYHPFRFFFQRIEVYNNNEQLLGAIQQRFSIFYKKFDIEGPRGNVILTMSSPIWRIWTFPILRGDREVAKIEKKWSSFLKEAFTDADNFLLSFLSNNSLTLALSIEEKKILLASAIFIDLQYFEKKANRE